MQQWKIPGLAVAIEKDDAVVFGAGVDLEIARQELMLRSAYRTLGLES